MSADTPKDIRSLVLVSQTLLSLLRARVKYLSGKSIALHYLYIFSLPEE